MERGGIMGKIISGLVGLLGIAGVIICYIGLALLHFVSITVGGVVMAVGFGMTAIFVIIAAIVYIKQFIADVKEHRANRKESQIEGDC